MNEIAVAAALEVMHAHRDALNARNPDAIAATLHFPHFRLSGEQVKIWESSETYLSDFHKRAGNDWGHTDWGKLEPIQVSDSKVHLGVIVKRFNKSGSPLVEFNSLWVISRINNRWAAQMRSSFAHDP